MDSNDCLTLPYEEPGMIVLGIFLRKRRVING